MAGSGMKEKRDAIYAEAKRTLTPEQFDEWVNRPLSPETKARINEALNSGHKGRKQLIREAMERIRGQVKQIELDSGVLTSAHFDELRAKNPDMASYVTEIENEAKEDCKNKITSGFKPLTPEQRKNIPTSLGGNPGIPIEKVLKDISDSDFDK